MKEDLQNLDTATILGMLAQKTERFTQLFADKMFNEEYEALKQMIEMIQAELNMRHDSNQSISDIKFEDPDITN
jgi:hypothetical protein